MTSVVIAPRVEDLTSDTEAVASGAWFRIRPSRAYKAGGQWVHPVWPASVTPLNGTAVTVKLDPNADVPYELELSIPDGNGGTYHPPNELRYVTASATPLNWEDLVQTAGPGTQPAVPSDVEAQLATLTGVVATLSQQVANFSGGATNIAGITDMPAFMKTVNASTTAAAARTALGAGTSNLAIGTTGTDAAPGTLSATVTTLNTTVTGNTSSIATINAALPNKANLSGSGFVSANDIDPAIARQTDVTAALSGVTNPDWSNVQNRPASVGIQLKCPGDVARPRTDAGAVPLGCWVIWRKKTPPPVGGPYMQDDDEYERWDG